MKVPITAQPMYYKRNASQGHICQVCRNHTWMVVQKIGPIYAMHTRIARMTSLHNCVHMWSTRREDPLCLARFDPTHRQMMPQIPNGVLADLLVGHPTVIVS